MHVAQVRHLSIFLCGLALTGCSFSYSYSGRWYTGKPDPVRVPGPPPEAPAEQPKDCAKPKQWVFGYWDWEKADWTWVEGACRKPPEQGAEWMGPMLYEVEGGFELVAGHWAPARSSGGEVEQEDERQRGPGVGVSAGASASVGGKKPSGGKKPAGNAKPADAEKPAGGGQASGVDKPTSAVKPAVGGGAAGGGAAGGGAAGGGAAAGSGDAVAGAGGGGTGAGPAKPGRPHKPGRPAKPAGGKPAAVAATPATPATPARPAKPAGGKPAAVAATPATPATPAKPARPAKPGSATAAATPAKPATPATPAKPARPARPGGGKPGAVAATPATPATPAKPARPVKPATAAGVGAAGAAAGGGGTAAASLPRAGSYDCALLDTDVEPGAVLKLKLVGLSGQPPKVYFGKRQVRVLKLDGEVVHVRVPKDLAEAIAVSVRLPGKSVKCGDVGPGVEKAAKGKARRGAQAGRDSAARKREGDGAATPTREIKK